MSPVRCLPLPALVFCRSPKRVEDTARELAGVLGWHRVGANHAGLTKDERTAIEEWFFHAEDAVLVATCAYGKGVTSQTFARRSTTTSLETWRPTFRSPAVPDVTATPQSLWFSGGRTTCRSLTHPCAFIDLTASRRTGTV